MKVGKKIKSSLKLSLGDVEKRSLGSSSRKTTEDNQRPPKRRKTCAEGSEKEPRRMMPHSCTTYVD